MDRSKTAESPPSLRDLTWRWIARRFPKRSRPIWYLLLALGALVGLILTNDRVYSGLAALVTSDPEPLEILRVVTPHDQPSAIDVIVRNATPLPIVITQIELVVEEVELAAEIYLGGTSLDISHRFDAVLDPRPGRVIPVSLPPIQILPESPERLRISLAQSREGTQALWGDYLLSLRLNYDRDRPSISEPFRVRVYADVR